MDKDDELAKIQRKLKSQESKICWHQQQKEELHQKYGDTKKKHKLEIAKINDKLASNTKELFRLRIHDKTLLTKIKKTNDNLASNTKELFRLRIHNKTLFTKIKKLKHSRKKEPSNEDLKRRILKKEEENQHLRNLYHELEEQIEKLRENKKS